MESTVVAHHANATWSRELPDALRQACLNRLNDCIAPRLENAHAPQHSPMQSWDRCQIRLLSTADACAVHALRGVVLAHLDNPDHYRPQFEQEGFVEAHLERACGVVLGVELDGELMAYGMLSQADAGLHAVQMPNHLDAEVEGAVAVFSSAMVLPRFRACGLHQGLIACRHLVCDHWQIQQRLALISPSNWPCWQNFARMGMPLHALVWRGERIPRLLAYQGHSVVLTPDPQTREEVPLHDNLALKQCFAQGLTLWARRENAGQDIAVFYRALPTA